MFGALVVIVLAVRQIAIERRVMQSEDVIEQQTAAMIRGSVPPPVPLRAIDDDAVPRVLINQALLLARASDGIVDPVGRRAALDRAVARAQQGVAARPDWGEGWTVAAYALSRRDGLLAPATAHALERSYDGAPYLRSAAEWRVQAGIAAWPSQSKATQEAIVMEALWLSRLTPELRDAVFALMRGSPAYVPFLLKFRALRETDTHQTG